MPGRRVCVHFDIVGAHKHGTFFRTRGQETKTPLSPDKPGGIYRRLELPGPAEAFAQRNRTNTRLLFDHSLLLLYLVLPPVGYRCTALPLLPPLYLFYQSTAALCSIKIPPLYFRYRCAAYYNSFATSAVPCSTSLAHNIAHELCGQA